MNRKLIGIIIVVVVIAGLAVWHLRGKRKAAEEQQPEIATAKVERGDLLVTVSAAGTLEPLTTVEVKPQSGGEITRIYVEPGDYVRAGDLIAQLDATQLQTQVDQARAAVDSARAQTQQAALQAESQVVTSDTGIEQAKAGVQTARARLRQAEAQYKLTSESSAADVRQAQASLDAARARLAQAQAQEGAQPALSESAVEQAQAGVTSAQEDLNRLLAGSRPQEIVQAEAAVTSAKARLGNARLVLDRQQGLLAKGFVSQQVVDDAQRDYDTAQATLDQAAAALDLAKEGPREEDIAQARARLAQAQAGLRSAQAQTVNVSLRTQDTAAAAASVQQSEASLRVAQANQRQIELRARDLDAARAAVQEAAASLQRAESGTLQVDAQNKQIEVAQASLRQATARLDDVLYNTENTTIVAPRDGVVMSKPVEEGTVIPGGTSGYAQATPIVTLADISQMFVTAKVDESDIGQVREAMKASVEVDVLPNRKLKGRVEKVYPEAKIEAEVVYYEVRVQLLEIPPELRPGMTADVTIEIASLQDVLLVPDTAVSYTPGKATVQAMEQGEAVEREIKVGLTDFTDTEVKEGLNEGDEVVLPSGGGNGESGGPGARGGPGGGSRSGSAATGSDRSRNVSRQMRMMSGRR